MRLPSCLTDPNALLVADASVAINLNATGCASRILRALPNRVVITTIAADEVKGDRQNGRRDAELLATLVDDGLIEIVQLSEAATIAHASELCGIALVEGLDREANRICGQRFVELRVASTVDVLAHASVQDALGQKSWAMPSLTLCGRHA